MEKQKGHHSEDVPNPFMPCDHTEILYWNNKQEESFAMWRRLNDAHTVNFNDKITLLDGLNTKKKEFFLNLHKNIFKTDSIPRRVSGNRFAIVATYSTDKRIATQGTILWNTKAGIINNDKQFKHFQE